MEYLFTLGQIKTGEIIITIFLCCLTRSTIYIRSPLRYILSIPLSIVTLYGLLLSILPSYTTKPNIQDFFQTQHNKIIIMSPISLPQEYIQIQTATSNKKINILTGQQEIEIITEKTKIQYISTTTKTQAQVFFISKNGNILQIFPQSSIEIQGIYPNQTEVQINRGKIATYISKQEEKTISFIINTGERKEFTQENTLTKMREKDKLSFFKKQRGNSFFYNPTTIKIQQFLLNIAQKILPQLYTEKRENFVAYREIIKIPIQTRTSFKNDTSQITQEILRQGNRGREETKLYQWIHNFF